VDYSAKRRFSWETRGPISNGSRSSPPLLAPFKIVVCTAEARAREDICEEEGICQKELGELPDEDSGAENKDGAPRSPTNSLVHIERRVSNKSKCTRFSSNTTFDASLQNISVASSRRSRSRSRMSQSSTSKMGGVILSRRGSTEARAGSIADVRDVRTQTASATTLNENLICADREKETDHEGGVILPP
jgi:hypothetical protein